MKGVIFKIYLTLKKFQKIFLFLEKIAIYWTW